MGLALGFFSPTVGLSDVFSSAGKKFLGLFPPVVDRLGVMSSLAHFLFFTVFWLLFFFLIERKHLMLS